MKDKFKYYFMDLAFATSKLSYATKLQVGAIAIKNSQVIGTGYNGTPTGWDNDCEDEDNNTHPWVLHAEENLIAKLCKSTVSSKGSVVFITHSPCIHCAKILYNSGIKKIYYAIEYKSNEGLIFLKKAGVKIERLSDYEKKGPSTHYRSKREYCRNTT